MAQPIIRIIFQHGRFNSYSTAITSNALFFYGFGLLSCCFIKILVNAFYAMQDTRTPVKTMAFAVLLNIVLSLIFMKSLQIGGLALASSLSATVNAGFLYFFLRQKVGSLDSRRICASAVRILIASLLMGLGAYYYDRAILETHLSASAGRQAIYLLMGILLNVALYLALALLFRIEELRNFIRWPRKI